MAPSLKVVGLRDKKNPYLCASRVFLCEFVPVRVSPVARPIPRAATLQLNTRGAALVRQRSPDGPIRTLVSHSQCG